MPLNPKLPPGRANRKALLFAVDIHRLRSAGYTFSAIRIALLDAGTRVSLSTIKREAARRGTAALSAQHIGVTQRAPQATSLIAASTGTPTPCALEPSGASGREVAEAFFNAHPSNPLFPAKETS